MNILIVGAGEVGGHLARLLSHENHNITVIDQDARRIELISGSLDVLAVEGAATSPSVLREARIGEQDMIIAVTTVDEVNILACMLAKQFDVRTKIARVRNREFTSEQSFLSPADLGIDLVIHPELEATKEIVRLIRHPQVLEMMTFCDEQIIVAGMRVGDGSPMDGKQLAEIDALQEKVPYRLVAVNRAARTFIPRGQDLIHAGDDIYVSAHADHLDRIFTLAGHDVGVTHHVMLFGATAIGRMVAEELEKHREIDAKLVETDQHAGEEAAALLTDTEVVIGDMSDVNLVAREGIVDMDIFAALSDDDEDNIVTSLLARHLKVPRTITLTGKAAYPPIIRTIGLDIAISPRLLTSNAILKYIRFGRIVSLRHMAAVNAETYEFQVTADSKVVGKRIRDVRFPEGSIVVAVEHDNTGVIPVGDTKIFVGDRVVIFCTPDASGKVMKMFD
ncbi:MAG: Trk system potassium uptake protein TrkA [Calditrichaeota bacterium]|nr:Trk system potassium uptake protein TrkA [Calditrichota bacterium]